MSVIVKNIEVPKTKTHLFREHICFIDSDKNVFIIGDEDTVINISSPIFNQYKSSYYEDIEDFLSEEFGTTLVKAFSSQSEFDIEFIVKS